MRRISLIAVLALLTAPASAAAQDIGVFADAASTNTIIVAPQGVETGFFVTAIGVDALEPPGLKGVEFRLDAEFTDGATLSWTPSPAANLALGQPFGTEADPGSCAIAWAECQTAASILIGTVTITVLDAFAVNGTTLKIRAAYHPHQQFFCPLMNKCDEPVFTRSCVPGGQAMLVGEPVALETRTWSEVKRLYD